MKEDELKEVVKLRYSKIAEQTKSQNESSCCGSGGCCSVENYTVFSDSYEELEGYHAEADLGLGCGLPTQYAGIEKGHHVLDLGSGAGNDCFVARSIVGEEGRVTGIDFTDAMLVKARENATKLGYTNVEFIKGDIEDMPLPDGSIDVIVSNCVLNLVPDKHKAFSEIMRVLKNGGHFCVSDVVVKGKLPESIIHDATMYAGCIAGALEWEDYTELIKAHGFQDVTIHTSKQIFLPDEILLQYLNEEELKVYHNGSTGLYSITISGYRKD